LAGSGVKDAARKDDRALSRILLELELDKVLKYTIPVVSFRQPTEFARVSTSSKRQRIV
jgi:hypothetical protein